MPPLGLDAAVAPGSVQPQSASRNSRIAWNVVLGLDLLFFAGLMLAAAFGPGPEELSADEIRTGLWVQVPFTLIVMGAIPALWAYHRYRARLAEEWGWGGAARKAGIGVLVGLAMFVALILVSLMLEIFGKPLPENASAAALATAIDWPLALALSLAAAVGEEILFRGVVQRWVGVVPAAALFAMSHLGYGNLVQVVVPFLAGIVLGVLRNRQGMPSAIAAHFAFNFVQFSLLLAAT